jgi:hypothetical protein
MNWYRLDLLSGVDEHVDEAWVTAWEVAATEQEQPDPSNAIFRKARPGGGWILYFTPSARLLAETFGAKACETPAHAGMSLVAGDSRAWKIHFPGSPLAGSRPFVSTQPFATFDTTYPMQG